MRPVMLAITSWAVTRRLVTGTRAGRAMVKRFVAGDLLADAVTVATELNQKGLKVSMDHLGEHVLTPQEAAAATASYLDCIHEIGVTGVDANLSVKLTQLGMAFDDALAEANLHRISEAALGVGATVTLDMEESEYTEATITHYERAQRSHGNLGIAIQAYLHRTPDDIDRITPLGGHIRLCKGAYREPGSVAHRSVHAVNDAYDHLAAVLMANNDVIPAIATHDDARIAGVLEHATSRTGPWEFQMLHGVRRDRQIELVGLGHTMRVYVPYGVAWYPYLARRIAERPANMTFFLRALVGK